MGRCILKMGVFLLLALLLGGCGGVDSESVGEREGSEIKEEASLPKMALNVNTYPVNQLVCNPFHTEEENMFSFSRGLKGEIFHVESGGPVGNSVEDYIRRARRSSINLFFKSLYIRTQKFLTGFNYISGGLVHSGLDEIIHDHFALRITGNLTLSREQVSGEYEFSLLSDDGAILRIFYQGHWVEVINGDGAHPTLYTCGNKFFHLEKGRSYPVEILYFQARKDSPVALVPLWRQVRTNYRQDPFCRLNQGGGGQRYFDENNHSRPFPAYRALGARGWQAIRGENFILPPGEEFNPCADSKDVPVISDFFFSFEKDTVTIHWNTDIPATSQVMYSRSDTGDQVLTSSDNFLRTKHAVTIPRNKAGVSYIVRAISISETFGKTVSGGYTLNRFF